jgi:hypothetical protein
VVGAVPGIAFQGSSRSPNAGTTALNGAVVLQVHACLSGTLQVRLSQLRQGGAVPRRRHARPRNLDEVDGCAVQGVEVNGDALQYGFLLPGWPRLTRWGFSVFRNVAESADAAPSGRSNSRTPLTSYRTMKVKRVRGPQPRGDGYGREWSMKTSAGTPTCAASRRVCASARRRLPASTSDTTEGELNSGTRSACVSPFSAIR